MAPIQEKISKYNINTFGCSFNFGDSKKIMTLLNSNGMEYSELSDADLIIINSCAVKHSTERKILHSIESICKEFPDKYLIIAGCLPQIDEKINQNILRLIGNRGFILHPHEINNINLKIAQFFFHDDCQLCEIDRDKAKIDPYVFPNEITAIIQISEGCNHNCAYCCTKNARGKLFSFDNTLILQQIKSLLKKGIKEFFLTAEDLGNYRFNDYKLHHLLKDISSIEGNFKIRLGMLNPIYLKKNLLEFLKIFDDHRYYRFVHIPIQSASNDVLKSMRRQYKTEDVIEIIDEIKNYDLNFSFATDIIVGFPSETKSDYDMTRDFILKWKPAVLNISKYSVRPNTEAKGMKQLDSQEIKNRSRDLSIIYKEYSQVEKKKWIGWKGLAFINEFNSDKEFPFMGRNNYYIPIMCKQGKIGEYSQLRISEVQNFSLIGI